MLGNKIVSQIMSLALIMTLTNTSAAAIGPQDAAPADLARLESKAKELGEGLTGMIEKYDSLLSNPWLRKYAVPTHLSRGEQAVKKLVTDGHVNATAVNDFHSGLEAFAKALDELPSWTPGTTGWQDIKDRPKPSKAECAAMARAIRSLLKTANDVEAFRAIEDVKLAPDSGVDALRSYSDLVVACLKRALYEKLLESVTGEGTQKTDEVMKAPLESLREALARLADARDPRVSEAPTHAEAVKQVTAAISAVTKAGKELSRYHPWAAERVELMDPFLKALKSNVERLAAAKKG